MISVDQADSIYVVAAPNCGSSAICDLKFMSTKVADGSLSFILGLLLLVF